MVHSTKTKLETKKILDIGKYRLRARAGWYCVLIGESNVAIDPAIGGYGVADIYLREFLPHLGKQLAQVAERGAEAGDGVLAAHLCFRPQVALVGLLRPALSRGDGVEAVYGSPSAVERSRLRVRLAWLAACKTLGFFSPMVHWHSCGTSRTHLTSPKPSGTLRAAARFRRRQQQK